jgi:hypothetical protein
MPFRICIEKNDDAATQIPQSKQQQQQQRKKEFMSITSSESSSFSIIYIYKFFHFYCNPAPGL